MTVPDNNNSTIIPHTVAAAVISSHQHFFFIRLSSIFSTFTEKHLCNLFMAIKTVEMRIILIVSAEDTRLVT